MRRTCRWVVLAALLAGTSSAGAAESFPAPPSAGYPQIDPLDYADDAAARAAWRPMSGSAAVSLATAGGARVLRLPCNFRGTKIDRASWDLKVNLDLTACRGIQLHLYCRNVEPISAVTLYFKSGEGWSHWVFHLRASGWNTIRLNLDDAGTEGRPAGWGRISALRLSAWRGGNADTELFLHGLGLIGADSPLVVVRGGAVGDKAEAKAAAEYARQMEDRLEQFGLDFGVLEEADLTAERLKGRKAVILPHSPDMPAAAAEALATFLRGGGKLLSFYVLPRGVQEAAGIAVGRHVRQEREGQFASIRAVDGVLPGCPAQVAQNSWNVAESGPVEGRSRIAAWWHDKDGKPTGQAAVVVSDNCIHMTHVMLPDDPAGKRGLLLAMLSHFAPECGKRAAERSVELLGRFGSYTSFPEAQKDILRQGGEGSPAVEACRKATEDRDAAARCVSQGKYVEAIDRAEQARQHLTEAYCLAQQPLAGEHRAFWCHSPFGVEGMTWDEAIRKLADNGFTAILPNMLWGGAAFYESDVLPRAGRSGDQIAQCLAACRNYGVQCHVWKVNWNMGSAAPRSFVEAMQREGRTQVRFDGRAEGRWLCPSHPANRKLEIDAMVEVARKYAVDGIHFDYIRYPGKDACFCDGCRERFEKILGRKVSHWPDDVRKDRDLEAKWLDFRRDNITQVVAAVSEQARKARPGIRISAAVFSNLPADRDAIGQDWGLWCRRGYLDFVCPMDYGYAGGKLEDIVRRQQEWAGKVPVYPGLGLSVWTPPNDVVKLIDQVQVARRLKTGGFTVFNYGASQAKEVLPLLGRGLTRKP